MPYTMEDFQREYKQELLKSLTPEQRLQGLKPEEVFQQFTPKEIEAYLEKLKQSGTKH